MTREIIRAAAVLGALALGGLPGTASAAEEGPYGVLVEAEGAELTYAYCAGCHSERLVAQQGLSRERWDTLLDWMVEEQGMAELEADERALILDYLAENYGPDRPNFPAD